MRRLISLSLTLTGLLLSSFAAAQDATPEPPKPADTMRIGLMAGVRGGIAIPFGGFGPSPAVGIEVGYAFPFLKRALAIAVDLDYSVPKKSGTQKDPRITDGGQYSWHLTEQELNLMPLFMYRATFLGKIVPYIGIGPRFFFVKSTVRSDEGKPTFMETTEQATKVGVGIPLGVEVRLGPGAIVGEILFQWASLKFDKPDPKAVAFDTATGTGNLGALNIAAGYRFLL